MSKDWTVPDIPSLAGKVALVTGANSGIGLEACRELARRGATVVLACRSVDRGRAAGAPVVLTIDRPFIFVIRDIPTGTVLLAGRVLHP